MSPVAKGSRAQKGKQTMAESSDPSQGTSTAPDTDMASNPVGKSAYDGLRLMYASPGLNKKNYVDWAAKIKILFNIQGVWTVVNGSDPEPNARATGAKAKDWRQRNSIALAVLGGSIEESEYRAIRTFENASEAWKRL